MIQTKEEKNIFEVKIKDSSFVSCENEIKIDK